MKEMGGMIGAATIVRRKAELISAEFDGEAVILDVAQADFLHLSATAARILTLLDEPMAIGTLCQRLAESFDIDAATCRDDVLAFIKTLDRRGLIEIVLAGADQVLTEDAACAARSRK